jgi:hypothetical protein
VDLKDPPDREHNKIQILVYSIWLKILFYIWDSSSNVSFMKL